MLKMRFKILKNLFPKLEENLKKLIEELRNESDNKLSEEVPSKEFTR